MGGHQQDFGQGGREASGPAVSKAIYRRPEVGLELWTTHSGPSWIFVCFEPELLADLGHTWRVGDLVSGDSVESKLCSFVGKLTQVPC